MIDVWTEQIIPLAELAEQWPSGKLNRTVVYRYAKKGVGPARVRLETIMVGGVLCSSREAVQRFVEACTEAAGRPSPQPGPAAKKKARNRAKRILDDAGL